ncbi:MAG: hypothetical protein KKD18_07290 [Nanoarchaeota archaeon]|nr:hypothetical protein [Nanoarchaeota archaeon]
MKYKKCNPKCKPADGIHWIGDRFVNENLSCCKGCGERPIPHYGFGSPCSASHSGTHSLNDLQAELNSTIRRTKP